MCKKIILITLLIIALAAVGALAYQQLAPTKEAEAPDTGTGDEKPRMLDIHEAPPAPDLPEIDTSGWRTYINDNFGYKLRYPPELASLSQVSENGIKFWFSDGAGTRFVNYEFFARQGNSCNISTASSKIVYLSGIQFTMGVHMLSDVVENPVKDGVVGIQYLTEWNKICYQLNYWERIHKGVRYSPHDIDEMDQFISQFKDIVSTFRILGRN